MSQRRNGEIVTFYSFKGGTGRSMALANVAWLLACHGKRVLVIDWDLESPGLQRFYKPFLDLDVVANSGGVIDLIYAYEEEARRHDVDLRPPTWHEEFARVERHALSVKWEFPDEGTLDLLPAGLQNDDYAATLTGLDWETFLGRLGGDRFFEALRADMKATYDYVLIDSRTGHGDVARICTTLLPDTVVTCFTLSDQGVLGAAGVANRLRLAQRGIRVLPVPMRVDQGEKEKAEAGRALAMRAFAGLPADLDEDERRLYWGTVQVPYRTFYAYEETLATFGDPPRTADTLLSAYEKLAAALTGGEISALPEMDETKRTYWLKRFERSVESPWSGIALQYAAEDQAWAEWIEQLLLAADVQVLNPGPVDTPGHEEDRPDLLVLSIVSRHYEPLVEHKLRQDGARRAESLGVYVSDVRPADLSFKRATSLTNLNAPTAAAKVLDLVGIGATSTARQAWDVVRFPGTEPRWRRLQQRDARFTGRAEDLQALRKQLKSQHRAVVLPVALQGMGGVGKTQLALEYAHRFRSAYDLVWWVPSDPAHFVNSALADLAAELRLTGQPAAATEAARVLLEALRRGEPTDRWLIVFDNAEDPDAIAPYLPTGNGHVIVTSRNPAWRQNAHPIPVDVFKREESVSHLRTSVPSLSVEDADRVAGALGDLPIALAAAAAWLTDTGQSVDDFLDRISRSTKELTWEATWDLSLRRLENESRAGHRLLQICSLMSPEIATDLLYSDEMAAALIPFDSSVSDRLMRGTPIQQVNRLGLVRVDRQAGFVSLHRLVQAVVRERMAPELFEQSRHIVHRVLAASRPNGEVDELELWPAFRKLWPHLEVSDATGCEDLDVRQLLIDRVRYLWRRDDLEQGREFAVHVAEAWTRQLEEWRRRAAQAEEHDRASGAETPSEGTRDAILRAENLERQLLHLRFNLANILRDQAKFEEALMIDTEVLERQRELLGVRHSHTLMTAGSRAADLRALGHYSEALPQEESTYREWEQALGGDHPRVLAAANNLAASLRAVGDFSRARELDETVYRRRRQVLTPRNPYSLHSGSCLGRDLRELGQYENSVALLRTVHQTCLDALGPDARGTLGAQANLATSLRSLGRPQEAQQLLDDATRRLTARLGPDNPHTLACRLNRAQNLIELGRTEEAIEEIRATTRTYEERLGSHHPLTLVCKSNLSAALRAAGRITEARTLAEEAALGLAAVLETDHPFTLAAEMNYATGLFDKGDAAAASEIMSALMPRFERTLGPEHPDTIVAWGNLTLMTATAPDSAEGLRTSVDALVELLGPEHPTVTSLRSRRPVYRLIDPSDPF